MKSRFIERLDAAIEASGNSFQRSCLNLEKASYLARRGDTLESEMIISSVRSDGQYLLSGEVSTWLNFAEGMQLHCTGSDTDARQKWMRALAIARAASARAMMARILSWLGFLHYTSINTELLVANTRHATDCMMKNDFEAIARTNLTIAQIFHLCGNAMKARDFYDRCRLACVNSSDDVMLAALIHNMAWLRMSLQRNEILQGVPTTEDRYMVEVSAESTRSYEGLIGAKSRDVMTPLLGAQVDIISERYHDAILAIDENLGSIGAQGLSRLNSVLIADRAYCRANIGDIDGAKFDALSARESISDGDHVDDLAILYARLSRVYELAGDKEIAAVYSSNANALWQKFRLIQDNLIARIDEFAGFDL